MSSLGGFGLNGGGSGGSGGGENLAQTLALGNSTDDISILSQSGFSILDVTDPQAKFSWADGVSYDVGFEANSTQSGLYYSDGTDSGDVTITGTDVNISHTKKITLDATNVNLLNETASTILSTDASKNIKSLSTSTYPSLTELSYVKGVTSAIQTQLDAKTDTIVITLDGGTSNPADASTYYCGVGRTTVTPTVSNSNFSLGFAGTLIGAIVSAGNNVVSGTTEDSTLKLRNETTATSTTIGTFKTNGSSNAVVNTTFSGLSIAIGASDLIAAQWDTPTWVTNPTGVLFTVTLIIRRS